MKEQHPTLANRFRVLQVQPWKENEIDAFLKAYWDSMGKEIPLKNPSEAFSVLKEAIKGDKKNRPWDLRLCKDLIDRFFDSYFSKLKGTQTSQTATKSKNDRKMALLKDEQPQPEEIVSNEQEDLAWWNGLWQTLLKEYRALPKMEGLDPATKNQFLFLETVLLPAVEEKLREWKHPTTSKRFSRPNMFHPSLPLKLECQAYQGKLLHVEMTPSDTGFSFSLTGETNEQLSRKLTEWIALYLKGEDPPVSSLPFFWDALPRFTKNVLQLLPSIPFGTTYSYQEVATALGHPNSSRAVGGACGRNPFPFFIPCHRVIASDGSLGGFSGGLSIKETLLDFEQKANHGNYLKERASQANV